MQTLMDKQQKYLLKKFHVLLAKAGINRETKLIMISRFGVESSRDLEAHQLLELCNGLEQALNPKAEQLDKERKRVMASIGGWLKLMRKDANITIIKGIACRAAETESFNDIPLERLRSIYNAFLKKQKDLNFAEKLTRDEIDITTLQN
jgi:malate synthase